MKNIGKKPFVTAIIVFTEREKPLLLRCCGSMEKSAVKAHVMLEFILVANGTGKVTADFLVSPHQQLSTGKNLGLGTAVNLAVPKAKSGCCILVCPDVDTGIDTLGTLLPLMENHAYGIVGPKIVLPGGKIQPSILSYASLWNIFLEQSFLYKLFPGLFKSPQAASGWYSKRADVPALAAIWWLFNRDVFTRTGGFDTAFFLYFEDLDFCLRLKKNGYGIIFEPEAVAYHRPHASTGGGTSGRLYYDSLAKILGKYHGSLYTSFSLFVFKLGSLFRLLYWHAVRNGKKTAFLKEILTAR